MASGNINYSGVLADLEARKAELESAIAAVKAILAAGGGGVGSGGTGGVHDPDNIPVGSFLRLTIVEAAKKLLDMTKVKLSVPQIAKALERGGLPPAKPNTIYAVLRRRESEVGDLIRFGDEWALAEWYPNNPNLRKKAEKTKGKAKKKTAAKKSLAKKKETGVKKTTKPASATTNTKTATPTLKAPDVAENVLKEAGSALDLKTLTERVNVASGGKVTVGLLKGMLHRDSKRFRDAGNDTWELVARTETASAGGGG